MAIQPRRRRSGNRSLYGLQHKLFHHTRFGGVPLFLRVWEICRIDRHLRELGIVKRGHPAGLLTLSYVLSALVGSRCLRQLTDRFRGDGCLRDEVAEGRQLGAHDWSRTSTSAGGKPRRRRLVIRRGEIWWASLGEPRGSAPGYRRPVLVVQAGPAGRARS